MNEAEETKPRRGKRKFLLGAGLLLALALTAYVSLLTSDPIDPGSYPEAAFAEVKVRERSDVSFSLLHTGYTDSPEAMIFRGGSLFETHRTQHAGVLIRHPRGLVLIDGGLGVEAPQDLDSMSWWIRPMFRFEDHRPARRQLEEAGIDPDKIGYLVLTHMHWDHASAIKDFPGARIVTTPEEKAHATGDEAEAPSFIKRQYEGVPAKRYDLGAFEARPYENFARSRDLFGDGAIVLVPMPGHTPGALGVFLNLSQERRYFFVGDTVWSAKAIAALAEKMPIARWLADDEPEGVRKQIVRLRRLQRRLPGLTIVPAHDSAVHAALPLFPEFSPR